MGVFDWKHWLVILLVAVLLFGGKKLRTLGSDVGEAIKGFKTSMADTSADSSGAQIEVKPGDSTVK